MRQPVSTLLTIVAIFFALPAIDAGAQTLAIYDGFDGPTIDPMKWRGSESFSSSALVITESARGIVNDRLRLALTTHGWTGSDSGLTGEAHNRLLINHPALVDRTPSISVLRTNVTVIRATAEDCAASDRATRTQAGLFGFFFNDGTGTSLPDDFTGDVFATLELRRDSRIGDTINASIGRCVNSACSIAQLLKSAVFSRTWAPGVGVTLTLTWQPGSNRFAFTAASPTSTETKILTYTVADTNKVKAFLKDLRVYNSVANCSAGAVQASIDARFNHLTINATAVGVLGE